MDRRKALTLLGLGALAGCGGGGGGGSATPAGAAAAGSVPVGVQQTSTTTADTAVASSTPAAAAASAPDATPAATQGGRNIACWGDSITALYSPHLQTAFADRQVFNGGVIGQTSAQINDRVQADTGHRDWLSIFWYGHNDWTKDQVAANLAASIATLAPGTPFVVVSMLNWATDLPGSTNYSAVLQVNAQLAQQYPGNFVDIRSDLVGAYDPSLAQDVIDHSNDETPTSLRFDTIHLNDAGCELVAAKLREFISSKGW